MVHLKLGGEQEARWLMAQQRAVAGGASDGLPTGMSSERVLAAALLQDASDEVAVCVKQQAKEEKEQKVSAAKEVVAFLLMFGSVVLPEEVIELCTGLWKHVTEPRSDQA